MNYLDTASLARRPNWRKHPWQFEVVLGILYRHDPVGICMEDNPCRETEYASEADTLWPCLTDAASLDDVRRIVEEEFCYWFGISLTAGRYQERFDLVALDLWQQRQSGTLAL